MTGANPQLPTGNSSIIGGITQNFAFHASPEKFITAQLRSLGESGSDLIRDRRTIRAKILNRDVAVVSSYEGIQQVLHGGRDDNEVQFEAAPAYEDFMAPFYPTPNLLLAPSASHATLRADWEDKTKDLPESCSSLLQRLLNEHLMSMTRNGKVDVYESMKTLAWKVLLGVFLGLSSDDADFVTIQKLQEDLLRGQFSLFPVNMSLGIWLSPRKRGVDARKKLQQIILARLLGNRTACPFSCAGGIDIQTIADHTLLFTSSLAVKGLASLLTAFFLNLYLFKPETENSLADRLTSMTQEAARIRLLSILQETERLSPPIVGVMRQATKQTIIRSSNSDADTLIPKGWDVWLYFFGGGRDPRKYKNHDHFEPDRYLVESAASPLSFGAGPKTCLGKDFARHVALHFAETCIVDRIRVTGRIEAQGVQAWLGWRSEAETSLEDWATDLKQLPTQHPTKSIFVEVKLG
ncbi:MAG: hypothetical protein M1828_004688 [Chrysothrix sp. TS-e1954]|nr:MAG: hypothetical protein M1828_004688 [Chrysothrix sp. TS-e1954]